MRLPFLELALTLLCALGSRPSTLRSLSSYYDSAAATSALYRIRNFAELEGPRRLETLCVCVHPPQSLSLRAKTSTKLGMESWPQSFFVLAKTRGCWRPPRRRPKFFRLNSMTLQNNLRSCFDFNELRRVFFRSARI